MLFACAERTPTCAWLWRAHGDRVARCDPRPSGSPFLPGSLQTSPVLTWPGTCPQSASKLPALQLSAPAPGLQPGTVVESASRGSCRAPVSHGPRPAPSRDLGCCLRPLLQRPSVSLHPELSLRAWPLLALTRLTSNCTWGLWNRGVASRRLSCPLNLLFWF